MPTETTPTVGKLPSQKYPTLGFTGVRMIHPLEHLFGLIVGRPKEGKSCLLQSMEDAWIANLDCSSTTTPQPKATIWPGIGTDGQPMDVDKRPMVLTWAKVQEKLDLICEMAKSGQPCPKTIVFDSLSAWIQLLKAHLIQERDSEVPERSITRWQDMEGRRYWDILYDMIISTCTSLRAHGRGVWLVCHVVDTKTAIDGSDGFIIRPELNITDNFYKRLYPMFEMVAAIERRVITESETIEQEEIQLKTGKTYKPKPKTKHHKIDRYFFTTDNRELKGIVGQRVKMPGELVLPDINGWEVVSQAYKTAAYV